MAAAATALKDPSKDTVLNEMIDKVVEDDYSRVKEMAEDFRKKNETVVLHFTGNVDSVTGKNWCTDCIKAEPVCEEFFKATKFKKKIHLIHVQLQKEKLRDKDNPFIHDLDIKLREVPTMVLYKESKHLNSRQCAQAEMLKLFFEDLIEEQPNK